MKIFMTGGTGFVGASLARELAGRGHDVAVLTRGTKKRENSCSRVTFIEGESTVRGPWLEEAARHDLLINLAGASIFSRWDSGTKRAIRESRLLTTNNLVEAVSRSQHEIQLFSTSAVGYYGFHGDEELAEGAPAGDDFLAAVARDWEAAAGRAGEYRARVVLCRFGIVLGRRGGALEKMRSIYKAWLGAPLGSGRQWFSWIHEQDLMDIFLFLIDRKDVQGPVNCTAPQPVRNIELTRAIGQVLGVPTLPVHVPGLALKILLGEFGDVLLRGQKVIPRKLLDLNFRFQFPEIQGALADLLGR